MTISKLKVLGAIGLAGLFAVGGARTYGQLGGKSDAVPPAPQANKDSGEPASSRLNEEKERILLLISAVREFQDAKVTLSAKFEAKLAASNEQVRKLQEEILALRNRLNSLDAGGEKPKEPVQDVAKAAANDKVEARSKDAPDVAKAGATPPPRVNFSRHGEMLFIKSPKGDQFTVYNMNTKKSQTVRLGTPDTPLRVRPFMRGGLSTLDIEGPKITRIAAATDPGGPWKPIDLREPVTTGKVSPVLGANEAVYILGRYVYAFSSVVGHGKWEVLELPEGLAVTPKVGNRSITLEGGGHIFEFNPFEAKWNHVNFNEIVDKVSREEFGEADAVKEEEKR